jgi:hypothetical protein
LVCYNKGTKGNEKEIKKMDDVKYIYRDFGEKTFRIHLSKIVDLDFGIIVSYEIQEPVNAPRNKWERLKQFFTVTTYSSGRWIPSISDDTLEERLNQAMSLIVKDWTKQNEAEKEWEKF